MNTSDVNKGSGFSSTNMSLSESVRFLAFIVKDIPKLAVKLPIKLLFSFERFYLWDIAKVLHFIVQFAVFIAIMKTSKYEIATIAFNIFGIESPLMLWVVTFVLIRVAFELVLVLLGIHNKLSSIADSIGKMDKERPAKG